MCVADDGGKHPVARRGPPASPASQAPRSCSPRHHSLGWEGGGPVKHEHKAQVLGERSLVYM